MIEKEITVVSGLESTLAALFVQNAGKFNSKVALAIGDKIVNAKSIMGVISLGVLDNQSVTITAEGEDEKEAMSELTSFLVEKHSE